MRLTKAVPNRQKWIMLIPALFIGACSQPEKPFKLADLTADEHTYIERIVVLERAKALVLADPELGNAILDSLALAWGDSAEAKTAAMAPVSPLRSKNVHDLLKRIIVAERDSLLQNPSRRRLSVPLTDPVVPKPEPRDSIPEAKE